MDVFYQQLKTFLVMFIFGFMVGVMFDYYRKISGKFILKYSFIIKITDFLFWVVCGIIGTLLLLIFNWGNLRFYIFLAIFLGIIFYFFILQKIVFQGD